MAKCKLTRLPPKRARGRTEEAPPHLDFLSYLDANVKAKEWARKGIEFANAGQTKQARECEQKAMSWLAKAQKMKPKPVRPWIGRQ